jgi:hypothetical protein
MEVTKEALEQVINAILERADEARRNSDEYKQMFEKSQFGLRGLIDDYRNEVNHQVLNLTTVIEDRTGKKVTNKVFNLLQSLPFVFDKLTEDIQNQEGSCCSVDKARELVYKYILENLQDS